MFFEIVTCIAIAVVGLVVGSFLNVCIARIPRGESIVFGRSHCMSCGAPIKPYDLVPVISYIVLRGRCRNCKAKISPRYPTVELLNALMWLAAYFAFGLTAKGLIAMAFLSVLIVISFIDIDTKLIPNGLVLCLAAVGVLACIFDTSMPFYENLLGVLAAGGPLLFIMLVSRGGMGGGDIKFMAAAGLTLGWKLSLVSLFFAFIVGAVFGLIYMLAAGKDKKSQIPFAPFLSVGTVIALFFGETLIQAYTSLLGI